MTIFSSGRRRTAAVPVTVMLAGLFVFTTAGPTHGIEFVCDISGSNIQGTSEDEVLCGTPGNDVIRGGGGDDVIYGLGG